jgi:hypothetical protein
MTMDVSRTETTPCTALIATRHRQRCPTGKTTDAYCTLRTPKAGDQPREPRRSLNPHDHRTFLHLAHTNASDQPHEHRTVAVSPMTMDVYCTRGALHRMNVADVYPDRTVDCEPP